MTQSVDQEEKRQLIKYVIWKIPNMIAFYISLIFHLDC